MCSFARLSTSRNPFGRTFFGETCGKKYRAVPSSANGVVVFHSLPDEAVAIELDFETEDFSVKQ